MSRLSATILEPYTIQDRTNALSYDTSRPFPLFRTGCEQIRDPYCLAYFKDACRKTSSRYLLARSSTRFLTSGCNRPNRLFNIHFFSNAAGDTPIVECDVFWYWTMHARQLLLIYFAKYDIRGETNTCSPRPCPLMATIHMIEQIFLLIQHPDASCEWLQVSATAGFFGTMTRAPHKRHLSIAEIPSLHWAYGACNYVRRSRPTRKVPTPDFGQNAITCSCLLDVQRYVSRRNQFHIRTCLTTAWWALSYQIVSLRPRCWELLRAALACPKDSFCAVPQFHCAPFLRSSCSGCIKELLFLINSW